LTPHKPKAGVSAYISLLEIYRAIGAPKAFAIHQYPIEKRCPVSCHIKPALSGVLDETHHALERRLRSSLVDHNPQSQ